MKRGPNRTNCKLATLARGWLAAGPSGFFSCCDRFTAATQDLPVATAPNHLPSGRGSEEEQRSGEGTQYESVGMQRWIELKDRALPAPSSRPSQGEREDNRKPCIPREGWHLDSMAPTTSSRRLRSAEQIRLTELPDGPVFLYEESSASTRQKNPAAGAVRLDERLPSTSHLRKTSKGIGRGGGCQIGQWDTAHLRDALRRR